MFFLLLYLYNFTLVFGLQTFGINLSIDYFKYRDVKSVCYIDCGEYVSIELFKRAFEYSISVSAAIIKHDNKNVKRCLEQQTLPIGVIMDSNCSDSEDILVYASESMYFDGAHKWLIFHGGNYTLKDYNNTSNRNLNCNLIDVFDKLNLSVDSDIIVAEKSDYPHYILYDVYSFGKIQLSEMIIENVGSWNNETGLTLNSNLADYKYYRRWNFRQCQLRMITVVSPIPANFSTDMLTDRKPVVGIAHITKTVLMCLHAIAEIHNIRFVYTITDRWIGTFERNSSRVVANSLYFKEQDITPVLRPMVYLLDKMDILHTPLTSIETRYFYRIPTSGAGKFENQFLRPLSFGTWVCVTAVIILCGVVLLLSAAFEQRPSFAQYAIFSVIASFCQQFFQDTDDSESKRVSTARKLAILVTGLSCVLIYNYYTSSVVSWLLNGPPPSINSLKELIESPLELIFEDIGYTRSWLQIPSYYYNKRNAFEEDELRRKKVFNKKPGAPLFMNIEEGIAIVKAGGYAYHTEVESANDQISRTFDQMELCELGSLQSMEKTHLHTCLQKNSPYKEFFAWSLLRILERGIVSCIQRRTSSQSIRCAGSSPRALALGGAAPAFILLFGGYILAVSIVIIERLVYKRRKV